MVQSQRPKCGTCRFFVVRNRDEVMLAQIARPEAECAPGEHTFQGKRIQGCVGGGGGSAPEFVAAAVAGDDHGASSGAGLGMVKPMRCDPACSVWACANS